MLVRTLIASSVAVLDAAVFLALIDVVFDDLWENAGDLLLQEHLELLLHVLGESILFAELLGQALRCVAFVDHDTLHALLSDVDVNVELWVLVLHRWHLVLVAALFIWVVLQRRRALHLSPWVLVVWHVLPDLLVNQEPRVVEVLDWLLDLVLLLLLRIDGRRVPLVPGVTALVLRIILAATVLRGVRYLLPPVVWLEMGVSNGILVSLAELCAVHVVDSLILAALVLLIIVKAASR